MENKIEIATTKLRLSKLGLNVGLMRKIVFIFALGIPLLIGHIEYTNSYHYPKWKVFLSGVIMGAPFSVGLFLSN